MTIAEMGGHKRPKIIPQQEKRVYGKISVGDGVFWIDRKPFTSDLVVIPRPGERGGLEERQQGMITSISRSALGQEWKKRKTPQDKIPQPKPTV